MGNPNAPEHGEDNPASIATKIVHDDPGLLNQARRLFPNAQPGCKETPNVVVPYAYSRVIPAGVRLSTTFGEKAIAPTMPFAVLVGADGRVEEASPLTKMSPVVAMKGRDALKQWRFRPGQVDGRKEPFVVVVALGFRQS